MEKLIIDGDSLKPNKEMIKKIKMFCQNQFSNNNTISLQDGLIEFDEESIIIADKLREFLIDKCGKKEEHKPKPTPPPIPEKIVVENFNQDYKEVFKKCEIELGENNDSGEKV